jgi:hypothetical protein
MVYELCPAGSLVPGMTMQQGVTLQQIDTALAAWNGRLEAVAGNLLWLQNDVTYQMLTGSGGAARVNLSGETAARVDPALATVRNLFSHFDMLRSTVDRAADIRKGLPAFFGFGAGSGQRLGEMATLLFGRSIQLPMTAIPAGQRTLLSGSRTTQDLSPEEALQAMTAAFAAARDAVVAVDQAWRKLAEGIDRTETQLAGINAPSTGATASLADIHRRLQAIRKALSTDPFRALDELTRQVEPKLAEVVKEAEAAERTRRELLQARAQLEALETLHRDSVQASEQLRAKVVAGPSLPGAPEEAGIVRLRGWLDQLDCRCAEGAFQQVATGLQHWRAAAQACGDTERSANGAIRATLHMRSELRGRLDALKAKARARGVSEEAGIAGIARQTEDLLAIRPTHLGNAAAAVAAYAQALNAAGSNAARKESDPV